MGTIYETSYAKNHANYKKLISAITSYGTVYNPSNNQIKLSEMETIVETSSAVMEEEHAAQSFLTNAINERKDVFAPLNKLITKIFNNLKSVQVSDDIINSVGSIVRQLRGKRATPKSTDPQVANISSSQVGFDDKVSNFDKLIKLLQTIPKYAPNEIELKCTTLIEVYDNLKEKNDNVISATTALNQVRIKRDNIFDAPETGLVDVALNSKAYIKSVFNQGSPQYDLVANIRFHRVKK